MPTGYSFPVPSRARRKELVKATAIVAGNEDYFVLPDVPSARADADAMHDLLVYTCGDRNRRAGWRWRHLVGVRSRRVPMVRYHAASASATTPSTAAQPGSRSDVGHTVGESGLNRYKA